MIPEQARGVAFLLPFATLRSQILFGFLLVMTVVLAIVGGLTFRSVSTLLTNNSETHIQQTAVQAGGRLDALIERINTFSLQIVTDARVQALMTRETLGDPADFAERQALMPIVQRSLDFITGVQTVELFNLNGDRLFPLGERRLEELVGAEWIRLADAQKGALVWIGPMDNEESVLAIRSIRLINRWFSPGGYLLVKIRKDYFSSLLMDPAEGMMLLADRQGRLVVGNAEPAADLPALLKHDKRTVEIGRREYVMVKKPSDSTGWTVLILTPVAQLSEGVTVLRNALLVSGAIGTALFLVLSFMLSTMITDPLRKLIRTMRSSRRGILQASTVSSSNREIRELNHTYNQMVSHINELIRVVYEKELLQSQTEIRALQAQINPHFLFNTLDTLYSSLEEKGDQELADLVMAMARLFRYTISKPGDDEWVTLREELEQVERYLRIMQARIGSRLSWRVEADPAALSVRIPKLTIQPLVENAIQHGVETKIGQGEVVISAGLTDEGRRLKVSVRDNGIGMDEERLEEVRRLLEGDGRISARGAGMGLVNVHRRIRLHYGGEGLRLASRSGEGTETGFEVPVEPPAGPTDTLAGSPVREIAAAAQAGPEARGSPAAQEDPAERESPAAQDRPAVRARHAAEETPVSRQGPEEQKQPAARKRPAEGGGGRR